MFLSAVKVVVIHPYSCFHYSEIIIYSSLNQRGSSSIVIPMLNCFGCEKSKEIKFEEELFHLLYQVFKVFWTLKLAP